MEGFKIATRIKRLQKINEKIAAWKLKLFVKEDNVTYNIARREESVGLAFNLEFVDNELEACTAKFDEQIKKASSQLDKLESHIFQESIELNNILIEKYVN